MAPLAYSFNYHKKKRPYNKYKYYTHENRSKFKNPIPRSSARFLKFLKVFKIILLYSHLSHPLYILLHTEIKRQKFQFYYLDERVMRLFYGKCSLICYTFAQKISSYTQDTSRSTPTTKSFTHVGHCFTQISLRFTQ